MKTSEPGFVYSGICFAGQLCATILAQLRCHPLHETSFWKKQITKSEIFEKEATKIWDCMQANLIFRRLGQLVL